MNYIDGYVLAVPTANRETCRGLAQKAMADPRPKEGMDPMPFDGKRMIYGGFQVIVDA